jgi:hypothetical protein
VKYPTLRNPTGDLWGLEFDLPCGGDPVPERDQNVTEKILQYASPPRPVEAKSAPSPEAAAMRLVGFAILFLAGAIMIGAGGICECLRPSSAGQPLLFVGVLIAIASGVAFFISWMSAPR